MSLEEENTDAEETVAELTPDMVELINHWKLQEEWADTEWLPEDFKS